LKLIRELFEKLPFVYLRLSVRGNPKRVLFWDTVLNRIRDKLYGWRRREVWGSGDWGSL